MLLDDERYVIKWLSQYGALTKTQVIRLLRDKTPETAEKILRNLKGSIKSRMWPVATIWLWMDYASRISGRSLPYGCCCGLSTMWIPWRIILRSTRPKSFSEGKHRL